MRKIQSIHYGNLPCQGTKAVSDARGQSYVSRQADRRKPSWLQGRPQPVCIKVPLPAYHQCDSHPLPPCMKMTVEVLQQ